MREWSGDKDDDSIRASSVEETGRLKSDKTLLSNRKNPVRISSDDRESEDTGRSYDENPVPKFRTKTPQLSRKKTTEISIGTPIPGPSRQHVTVEITQKSVGKGVDRTSIRAKSPPSPSKCPLRSPTPESTPLQSQAASKEGSPSTPNSRESRQGSAALPINQRSPLRRSAATKATQKLREVVMPDLLSFQKEMKTGRIRNSWEGSKGKGKENAVENRRRRVSGAAGDADEIEADERSKKRRKVDTQSMKGSAEDNRPTVIGRKETATVDLFQSDVDENGSVEDARVKARKTSSTDK